MDPTQQKIVLENCTKQYSFNPTNAPAKMKPFILGDDDCKSNHIFNTVKECFLNKEDVKNGYVFKGTAKGNTYFFKRKRKLSRIEKEVNPVMESTITPDSPAYRVRKAEKVRRWIKENGYENDICVPQKYLYWDTVDDEWYSVAEVVDLSEEVASVNSKDSKTFKASISLINEGQCVEYKKGKHIRKERSFTERQARALAELSFKAGYTDMSYNNLFFDKQGRVAIIDTESILRGCKKINRSVNLFMKILNALFWDWGNWNVRSGLQGTARLKCFCKDEKALAAVESVEIKHVVWSVALKIGKIALTILAIKAIALVAASASVPALALLALKIVSIIAKIRVFMDVWNLLSTAFIFHQGRQGLQGVNNIQKVQMMQIPIL